MSSCWVRARAGENTPAIIRPQRAACATVRAVMACAPLLVRAAKRARRLQRPLVTLVPLQLLALAVLSPRFHAEKDRLATAVHGANLLETSSAAQCLDRSLKG